MRPSAVVDFHRLNSRFLTTLTCDHKGYGPFPCVNCSCLLRTPPPGTLTRVGARMIWGSQALNVIDRSVLPPGSGGSEP